MEALGQVVHSPSPPAAEACRPFAQGGEVSAGCWAVTVFPLVVEVGELFTALSASFLPFASRSHFPLVRFVSFCLLFLCPLLYGLNISSPQLT